MKTELMEHAGCFEVAFTAETAEDAAKLCRMGVNATKEVRSVHAYAYSSNTISGSVVIGKRKQATGMIKHT